MLGAGWGPHEKNVTDLDPFSSRCCWGGSRGRGGSRGGAAGRSSPGKASAGRAQAQALVMACECTKLYLECLCKARKEIYSPDPHSRQIWNAESLCWMPRSAISIKILAV